MNGRKLTSAILIGFGTAAATAYFAHPKHGRKRREALASGTKKLIRKAAHTGEKSLRDGQNRLAGLAAQFLPDQNTEIPSDRVVEERIRSRMGRVSSNARKIHVLCDHGTVTLWGTSPEEELNAVVRVAEATHGVTEVLNHIEVGPAEEIALPDLVKDARNEIRLDWSPSKRLLVGTTGAALAIYGWKRNDMIGKALSLLGTGLAARSTMQNHLRASLAIGKSSPGFEIERTIRINAPISDLYDFWANPENYPKAFSHVARIERLGENLYRWTVNGPGGIPIGWEGVITRTIPNTLVEWKSLPGSPIANFGVVHFDPHYDASTRVHVRMFYRPPAGILGRFFAELLGADANQILDQDLKHLKHMFEKNEFPNEQKKSKVEEAELLKTATT